MVLGTKGFGDGPDPPDKPNGPSLTDMEHRSEAIKKNIQSLIVGLSDDETSRANGHSKSLVEPDDIEYHWAERPVYRNKKHPWIKGDGKKHIWCTKCDCRERLRSSLFSSITSKVREFVRFHRLCGGKCV